MSIDNKMARQRLPKDKGNWKKQVLDFIGESRISPGIARDYGFDNANEAYSGIWFGNKKKC